MIYYRRGGASFLGNMMVLRGSVFPQSLLVALPASIIAFALRLLQNLAYFDFLDNDDSILSNSVIWSGVTFLISFLVVFRTSQAYQRWWNGCTFASVMRAEWFDAASSLISFCRFRTNAPRDEVFDFQNLTIRLFSMLHAAAFAKLEEDPFVGGQEDLARQAFNFELIDAAGIDFHSLENLRTSPNKAELIFSWIQSVVVDSVSSGVLTIPPPILSRSFQELANGMVAFHEAQNISSTPFPFPYAQTCDCLLIMQALAAPVVVAKWVKTPLWAAVFCFIPTFILWALNIIAIEIEDPFGHDANDLDARRLQVEMNSSLRLLLMPCARQVPFLTKDAVRFETSCAEAVQHKSSVMSFKDAWARVDAKTSFLRRLNSFTSAVSARSDAEQPSRASPRFSHISTRPKSCVDPEADVFAASLKRATSALALRSSVTTVGNDGQEDPCSSYASIHFHDQRSVRFTDGSIGTHLDDYGAVPMASSAKPCSPGSPLTDMADEHSLRLAAELVRDTLLDPSRDVRPAELGIKNCSVVMA